MGCCDYCHYFTDEGKCLIRKTVSSEQLEQGCDSFIDKEFKPQVSGCCGIYNMPSDSISPRQQIGRESGG